MSQNPQPTGVQVIPPEHPDADARSSSRPDRPWWKQYYPWLAVLGGTVVFNLLWAFPRYLTTDPRDSRSELDPNFHPHLGFLIAHVTCGNLALMTMTLQVWPWLRRTHPAVHRWVGRVYVWLGVVPSSLIVLFVLIPHRANDGSTGLGFGAVLWLGTTLWAWRKARLRRYAEHRRWMIYSFALALFTTYGRIVVYMMLHWGLNVNIRILVEATSWGAWVVNLLAAQWYLEYTARRRGKNLPAGRYSPATGAIRN
ncbi:DUF2306 domain-containing protein [Catenulispora yoronensis]|uniref:DUF2306 domain-containing protein n=1 Tax=Catenulispora yoronensis TaxID=450799 RepID=A0ABP5GT54_9ACTN